MLIKTDLKSNQAALLRAKLATFVLLFLSIPVVIYLVSCSPKTQLEKLTNAAPQLYDSQTNQAIPSTQQLLIPTDQIQDNKFQPNNNLPALEQISTEKHWISPAVPFNNTTGRFYLHVDFAGQQHNRKDLEITVLPICELQGKSAPCRKTNLNNQGYFFNVSTNQQTEYQSLKANQSWLFYGHDFEESHSIPYNTPSLRFIVKANIPEGLSINWLRLSISENPITLQQTSIMLGRKYIHWFKYALTFLPVLGFLLFHFNQGFESGRALTIGLLSSLLFTIHTAVWDINYMVFGCLLLSLASVLYCFGNSLYRLLYLTGFLVISGYAQQKFGGFNHAFFTQTTLILIIGLGLYFAEFKDQ